MSIEPTPLRRPVAPALPVPPHNLEAEQAVLGSALLDGAVVGVVASMVEPRDFYHERHATIFAAMRAVYERSEPLDYLTLIDELEGTGNLERAGGVAFLSGLLGAVPTPVHAGRYAQIVADAAFLRRLISAGGRIAALGYEAGAEPQVALEASERLLHDVPGRTADRDFVAVQDVLGTIMDNLAAAASGEVARERAAVPTGFIDADRLLAGGLERGNLVLLAARPGMGKTALAMGIADRLAAAGGSVAVFSLEMSALELVSRLLATRSGVDLTRLRTAQVGTREAERIGDALGGLASARIYIDDTPQVSPATIAAKAGRLHRQQPLDLVVVDHLQLMTGGTRRGENRVQEMAAISGALKALARTLDVPVLALSQLSRAVEQRPSKVPVLSDLRDSGSLEQDADVVMFLHRDDYYDRESERAGMVDVHVSKHRNGPTGTVSLLFNQRTTKFLDLEVTRDYRSWVD